MPISEELKARMAEGKRKAKAEREAAKAQEPAVSTLETVSPAEAEEVAELALDEPVDADSWAEPEPAVSEPTSPFEVFVASLTEETREELSYSELREIFEQNERDAKAERRKALRATATAKAKDHARANAGVLTAAEVERKRVAEWNNKPVRVTVKMPFLSDSGGTVSDGITIDGVKYVHGWTGTLPRGKAIVLRDIIYQQQQGELTFEGKGRLHGMRQQRAAIFNDIRYSS